VKIASTYGWRRRSRCLGGATTKRYFILKLSEYPLSFFVYKRFSIGENWISERVLFTKLKVVSTRINTQATIILPAARRGPPLWPFSSLGV
jgi:hypothetical protein